jgi:hypothetical protein
MPRISKDYIDNFGNAPLSPYMSGEQGSRTAALAQGAGHNTQITGVGDQAWDEPGIHAPERSMNTVVFQSKNGGNTVVVNDEGSGGDGYILITHKSGSAVQIDEHGTVFIKSFGDTHNNTEGIHYQHSKGDTNMNVGGSWNVRVDRGAHNVFVRGDVNIECENYNVTARGKVRFNAGEAIELRGSKFSMEAHTDNFDLIAKNLKINTTESMSIISRGDIFFATETELNIKSKGTMFVESEVDMNLLTAENLFIQSGTNSNVTVGENLQISVESNTDYNVDGSYRSNVGGAFDINAGSNSYFEAPKVYLASGAGSATSAVAADEATAASDGVLASVAEMPDPPARGPAETGDTNAVAPRPSILSTNSLDDVDD